MPLTAGVRRTLGLTKGRPGVKSTICARRRAARRARRPGRGGRDGRTEHRPRSATSTSPGCKLGCTACTWARSWVRRGATTSFRSTPVPAWNSPRRSRHGKAAPRPLLGRLAERVLEGRGIGHGASRAIDEKGAMPMPPPFVQGGSLHGAAEALQAGGQRGAVGVWPGLDSRPPPEP